ncbi:G5 domain-containing protein [Macrococcus equi]|uniref:G5 domain-containing protein n=1 Tax=Macrococcus equi TaxID=3395462 RepID=UPI0039BE742F
MGTKKADKPHTPVVYTELKVVNEPVDYQTEYTHDPTLLDGKTIEMRAGEKGEREKGYKQKIVDGKVKLTTLSYDKLVIEPVNRIIRIGTRKESYITSGIDSKYQDGRFNVDTLGSYHGYLEGKTTFRGDKITKVNLKVDKPLNELALESDDAKAQKAADINLINKVNINSNNLLIWMEANHRAIQAFNNNEIFNNQKFNDEMVRLINIDRTAKGLNPIAYRSFMQAGADIRANELAQYGDIYVNGKAHVRLNGDLYKTAFEPELMTKVNGENTLARTYSGNPYELVSEKYLAKKCFEQWKGSEGHYKQMMAPDFKGVTTSIKLGIGNDRSTYMVANQNFSKE